MLSWWNKGRNVDTSKLPPGDLGRAFVGDTFNFHSNAQGLILSTSKKHPGAKVIRASVINRDVGLILDYNLARQILTAPVSGTSMAWDYNLARQILTAPVSESSTAPRFSHREAYKQLIAAFFSEPNILLEDEDEPHRTAHREAWDQHFLQFNAGTTLPNHQVDDRNPGSSFDIKLKSILSETRSKWQSNRIDLYGSCKDLAHEIVFELFLGLSTSDLEYKQAENLTTTSLRGQFSIPVRLGFGGFAQSTYSKGLSAQLQFNSLVEDRVESGKCPFLGLDSSALHDISRESLVSHISMFSSSLVIKALTSLFTFAILERTRYPSANLDHLILETFRLCPPIIGVLRKIMDSPFSPSPDLELPEGWDVWLYFPLINRDVDVYGEDAWTFRAERWEDSELATPLTFGVGGKKCIGIDLISKILYQVLGALTSNTSEDMEVSQLDQSLQHFLGWPIENPQQSDETWSGVKQLPVQRPKDVVWYTLKR